MVTLENTTHTLNALMGVLHAQHFPSLYIVFFIFTFVAAIATTETGTAQETDARVHKVSYDSYYVPVYSI